MASADQKGPILVVFRCADEKTSKSSPRPVRIFLEIIWCKLVTSTSDIPCWLYKWHSLFEGVDNGWCTHWLLFIPLLKVSHSHEMLITTPVFPKTQKLFGRNSGFDQAGPISAHEKLLDLQIKNTMGTPCPAIRSSWRELRFELPRLELPSLGGCDLAAWKACETVNEGKSPIKIYPGFSTSSWRSTTSRR